MSIEDNEHLDKIAEQAGLSTPPVITFELGGVTFTALPDRPLGALMQLYRSKAGSVLEAMAVLADVVWHWTVPEQRDELDDVFSGLTSLGVLNDVIADLTEKSLRPFGTGPSSASAG